MNIKSKLNHEHIKHLLNRSVAGLEQPVLLRLRNARAKPLVRYQTRYAAPTFAMAGYFTWNTTNTPLKTHLWATAVLLVAILFGATTYWNQVTDNDTSDVDIAILTDDLPMHIYID